MNSTLIQKRMPNYAAALNDMLTAVLDDQDSPTPIDRSVVSDLLDTVAEVNTLMVYYFQCGPIPLRDMADIRAKVAGLTRFYGSANRPEAA
jgi:hypothetical protein